MSHKAPPFFASGILDSIRKFGVSLVASVYLMYQVFGVFIPKLEDLLRECFSTMKDTSRSLASVETAINRVNDQMKQMERMMKKCED